VRPHERHEEIVKLVNALGEVSVNALADKLGMSKETVRRDLADLGASGRIQKFHGGARCPPNGSVELLGEGPFAARLSENRAGKRAIARAAAGLLVPGDSLFLDTGTTTLLFAEVIVNLPRLTVITNSSHIASIVAGGADHKVFLIGGAYSLDASETVGTLAVEQIQRLRARYAFLTVGALSQWGMLDFDERETQVAKAMIERVETVNVLADSSKFLKRGIFEVAPWSSVDRLISDRAPPPPIADAMQGAGTELLVAAHDAIG
jgi:DeoR family glycerol-3-phosphate regulon repressor